MQLYHERVARFVPIPFSRALHIGQEMLARAGEHSSDRSPPGEGEASAVLANCQGFWSE